MDETGEVRKTGLSGREWFFVVLIVVVAVMLIQNQVKLSQLRKANAGLNDYCDAHETFMSSHIPGSNWSGKVYDPIYYACAQNDKHAGYFFGLIVWHVVQNRGDEWCFYRSDTDDREYVGLTYFRKK